MTLKITLQPDTGVDLAFHPSQLGDYSVIRWISPVTSFYNLNTVFTKLDSRGNGVDIHIFLNSTELYSTNLIGSVGSKANYANILLVQRGEAIYFKVGIGPDNSYSGDSTDISAKLTAVPTHDTFSAAFGDKTQVDNGVGSIDDPLNQIYNTPTNAPDAFFQWAQGARDQDSNGITGYHGHARTDDLNQPADLSHHFILRGYPAFDPTQVSQATVRFDVHYDEGRGANLYITDELLFWDEQAQDKPYRFFYGARLHDQLHNPPGDNNPNPARWSTQWISLIMDLKTGETTAFSVNPDGSLGTSYGIIGRWGDGNTHLPSTYVEAGTPAGVLQLASDGSLFGATNDDLILSYVALEGSTASRTVSGAITLEGAVNPAQPLTFTFIPVNGAPSFTHSVTLNADKTFALSSVPGNAYTIHIKGAKWLAKNVSVDATNADVTNLAATLKTGDANNDNYADIADLLLLIGHYNQVAPNAGYSESADFNGDGSNDITDLLLLIGNYNRQGDL